MKDLGIVNRKFYLVEGQSGWDYMADVVPDMIIDMKDLTIVLNNFGKTGTYINSTNPQWLSGVIITFNTGEEITPDGSGFVTIPQGATSFTVKRNGTPVGAMIIFW